jgi:hypothetical protein
MMRLIRLLRCLGTGVGVVAAVTVASASPVSAQPVVTVTPDTDLIDFQTVMVSGSGFAANNTVVVGMCTAGPLSVFDDCDIGTAVFVNPDATGAFTTQFTVERLIETPVGGQVDCAVAPGACILAVVNGADFTVAASAPLAFDPNVPPEPRLEIGLTIDPIGSVTPKTGAATVSGTVTCSFPAQVVVDVSASQRAGHANVLAFGFAQVACDGEATWTASLEPFNGRFVGGRLNVNARASGFTGPQGRGLGDAELM